MHLDTLLNEFFIKAFAGPIGNVMGLVLSIVDLFVEPPPSQELVELRKGFQVGKHVFI